MSLFKVRDFWSFDLDQLKQDSNDHRPTAPDDLQDESTAYPGVDCVENSKTQFIVDIGRFSSIGERDVFVCGHLEGHIYIVQVPDTDQQKFIKITNGGLGNDPISSNQIPDDVGHRQLLAAKSLNMLLFDLKCGFFTSTLKQSIAVLGPDKLLILTVNSNQIDLMTGDDMFNANKSSRAPLFENGLLSHRFEVHVKLDLLVGEFAFGLVVLNCHKDGCLMDSQKNLNKKRSVTESDSISSQDSVQPGTQTKNKIRGASRQVVQQLLLPQRDKIVIQYVNQFVFTLIDNKKVVGHFDFSAMADSSSDFSGQNLGQSARCFGTMPMAQLITCSNSSLVISSSDHSIYCLPIDKLTKLARQGVFERVAMELITNSHRDSRQAGSMEKSRLNSDINQGAGEVSQTAPNLIQIDLDLLCEWSHELTSLPIQLQGLRRKARSLFEKTAVVGQLLVMSRYSLDLFSNSGEHLWHQRFETPLIHLYAYTIESLSLDRQHGEEHQTMSHEIPIEHAPSSKDAKNPNQRVQMNDQVVSLVCSAGLRDDRSSLTILKDDRLSWSAALNSRPLKMWRLNLSRISGLIATLDVGTGHLIVSYLGTNTKQGNDMNDEGLSGLNDELNSACESENLVELERLNEPLFTDATWTRDHSKEDQRERLQIANRIELGPSDGIVNVSTTIRLDSSSTSVLHNITLTFEFDDIFEFELINDSASNQTIEYLADGVVELKLGNCWPDRREPIKIEASFSLPSAASSKLTGAAAIEQHNIQNIGRAYTDSTIMPKLLGVYQHLTFNETHSGMLRQESSFLLPISVVAKLHHVDYTSGSNQDLNDVLDNLTGYKWSNSQSNDKLANFFCDLFLSLWCDLFMLLHELIEGDLICRGKLISAQSNLAAANNDQMTHDMKLDTLENISLLAQSLDCRIRYMSPSPSGINRQSSEELIQPTMLSVALALRNRFPQVIETKSEDSDCEPIVWVHVCDLTKIEEPDNIVADFITAHMKGWKIFSNPEKEDVSEEVKSYPHESKILISIESQHPLAVVFVLNHLIARTERLSANNSSVGPKPATWSENSKHARDFIDDKLNVASSHLAISSTLHEALLSFVKVYETQHKPKINQLQTDLTREFVGYQAVIDGSLSSAKRLSSLPDDLSCQLDSLMLQAKDSHQKLMSSLDELEKCRRRDVEFSKLPMATMIKLQPTIDSGLVSWPAFNRIFD